MSNAQQAPKQEIISQPTILPQTSDDGAAVMALIANAASDPAFDVAKLEKLMDLRDRVAAGKAREAFAADFVKMKPNLPLVIRLHKNSQTNSKYAKLEDINQKIDPVLAQFGFATTHKVISQTEKAVTARVELWHRAGHVESTTLTMPLDDSGIAGKVNKTAPHAISSTIMYIRRVGECALLNISTGNDNDGNSNGESGTISIEQAADIDLRARAVSEPYHGKFLKWLEVETAREIPSREYKKAITALEDAEKQKAEKEQKAKGANA